MSDGRIVEMGRRRGRAALAHRRVHQAAAGRHPVARGRRRVTSPQGVVAPGYEPVHAAFARDLSERGDSGAAFAAVVDGEPVVDLWGGVADPASGRPWQSDTAAVIFSGTKGWWRRRCCFWSTAARSIWTPPWRATGRSSRPGARRRSRCGSCAPHAAGLPGVPPPLDLTGVAGPGRPPVSRRWRRSSSWGRPATTPPPTACWWAS